MYPTLLSTRFPSHALHSPLTFALSLALTLSACRSDDRTLTVGVTEPGAAGTGDLAPGHPGQPPDSHPDLTMPDQDTDLDVGIKHEGARVEILVVDCAGECITVQAAVYGAAGPFAYLWDDGSTTAQREVCPEGGETYAVQVEMLEGGGEFAFERSGRAEVAASALDCSAAGGPDGPWSCAEYDLDAPPPTCTPSPVAQDCVSLASIRELTRPVAVGETRCFRASWDSAPLGAHFVYVAMNGCEVGERLGNGGHIGGHHETGWAPLPMCVTAREAPITRVGIMQDGGFLSPQQVRFEECDRCPGQ